MKTYSFATVRKLIAISAVVLMVSAVACSSCASGDMLRTAQNTNAALATAQDIEAQICWGVTGVRDPRVPADVKKCTTELASAVQLTDERHLQLHALFVKAFDAHKAATTLLKNGQPANLIELRQLITEILAVIAQLQPVPQVQQLKSAVEAGRVP